MHQDGHFVSATTDAAAALVLAVILSYCFATLYHYSCPLLYVLVGCAFAIPSVALSLWVARDHSDWLSVLMYAWNTGGGCSWLVLSRGEHANAEVLVHSSVEFLIKYLHS